MKKLSIILGVLVLSMLLISGSALAVPIQDSGEPTLQSILQPILSGIDVVNDQVEPNDYWSAAGNISATLIVEYAGFAPENSFGIYNKLDIDQKVVIFSGADAAPKSKEIAAGAVYDSFGFYFLNKPGDCFYSDTSLNPDRFNHMVAYKMGGGCIFIHPSMGRLAGWR